MMTKSSLLLLIQKSLAMLDFKRCFHSGSSHCLIPRKGQRFKTTLTTLCNSQSRYFQSVGHVRGRLTITKFISLHRANCDII